MYIALTMQKLLEEKGEFKKLAGIPVCVVYNQNDSMSVQDHIQLNEAKLKEEYMETMTIGEPSLDIGIMISDLLWKKTDGILILEEEEAKLLQKNEIQRDRYTLYVTTSLKEALEIYRRNSKKGAGKRAAKKSEKPQKESDTLKQAVPDTDIAENIASMMEPQETNGLEEGLPAVPEESVPETEPEGEIGTDCFEDGSYAAFEENQEDIMEYGQDDREMAMVYEQEDQTGLSQPQGEFNNQKYGELNDRLVRIGVPDSLIIKVMMALQKSTNVSDCYDCMEETIGNIDDVLVVYDAIQGYYDTLKMLADQVGQL